LVAAALALAAGLAHPDPSRATDNPCLAAEGDPDPPIGQPQPEMKGSVRDHAAGVEGAIVHLFRCNGATAAQVATTATDVNGQYAFTNLTPGRWYYVEVQMSGPLAGKSLASGTQNPTALIGIGNSATGVDFALE